MISTSFKDFYYQNQSKLIVLTPLVLGLGFFFLSVILALITINSSKFPKDFDLVSAEIQDYNIYQINTESNELRWVMNAESGTSNPSQTEIEVSDVAIKTYDKKKLEFIINSKEAKANEETKSLELHDHVEVNDAQGRFKLLAGELKFTENFDLLVNDDWKLTSTSGYQIIGQRGIIDKNLASIISTGNAQIKKGNLNLKADKIIYNEKQPIEAIGRANLVLDQGRYLKANRININMNGNTTANGNVQVHANNITCFSNALRIQKGANGKPQYAYLTGSPYAIQNGKKITANKIVYDFNTNAVNAQGNVHTSNTY